MGVVPETTEIGSLSSVLVTMSLSRRTVNTALIGLLSGKKQSGWLYTTVGARKTQMIIKVTNLLF